MRFPLYVVDILWLIMGGARTRNLRTTSIFKMRMSSKNEESVFITLL